MKKVAKKKSVQKAQSPVYFRYEFSDESGRPEGGDIFPFSSMKELKKMLSDVVSVAQEDGVTVSVTIGQDDHFFNYLKNTGLSQKEVDAEMVDLSDILVEDKKKASPAKKKTKKKTK